MELAQSSAQRIVDGVLENYGKCERRQPDSLDAASKLLDDLSVADQFIGTAFGKDCFSALPYAAASAGLSAHSLYSVDSPPLMKRPTDRIFRSERQKHSSALCSLDDSRARYGGQLKLGCSVLALDVCASLRWLVLKPGSVRPVNPDLLRQPEREALDNGRPFSSKRAHVRTGSILPKPDEPPRPFKFRLRPDVASVSLFADAAEEPLSDVLRQTLARKVLVEKARRRERAEAEKRREQKPIKKRQSVAPVDAETLLRKAAARCGRRPSPNGGASPSPRGARRTSGRPAESDGEAQGPGAAGTGVAAGLRGAVQVQEGPVRRPARGDVAGVFAVFGQDNRPSTTPPARQLMAQPATLGRLVSSPKSTGCLQNGHGARFVDGFVRHTCVMHLRQKL